MSTRVNGDDVIIALDKDVDTVATAASIYSEVEFWQFRTPLTQYKSGDMPYILDNGVYSGFDEKSFERMVKKAKFDPMCRFTHWDDFDCLFIGGSTEFKMSRECYQIAQAAILEGKHVHVGRVNTPMRIIRWFGNCHSIDGSGLARFPKMLHEAALTIAECQKYQQKSLLDFQ
jgi:hypothetical protein